MVQYGILVDYNRCIGCRACELACKEENGTPEDVQWIRNIRIGTEYVDGKLVLYFVSIPCMHCGSAPCITVCPTKAIRRESNGAVLVEKEKCIGCRYCLWVCPFGAPQFDAGRGKITKCCLCVQRLEKGLEPACVSTCYMKALRFGSLDELSNYARQKAARKIIHTALLLGV